MLALVVGIGAAAVGAMLLACVLRPRSAVSYVLETYLFVWAELLIVCFVLSIGSRLERWSLLAGLLVLCGAAAIVWSVAGRPRPPPSLVQAPRLVREAASDPLVAILLMICALALTYTLVVTLSTAPNDGDPLVYEITRAAFWRQQHGIGILGAGYQPSLDFWPPVAETGTLAVITLSGSERYVGLTQWAAVWMLAAGTFGVARRIGLKPPAALWSAALVPTLPVVLAQSWSAFTDVVFASFAVSAVYFGIGALGLELLPFALAVGLATGTKYLGPIFAPLFAVILGVAQPRRRWLQLAGAALAGTAVAGAWYARTQIEHGDPAGNNGVGLQSHDVASVITTFQRMTVEVLDLSGASERGVWVYSLAALVALVVGGLLALRRDPSARPVLLSAAIVAGAPFVVREVARAWAAIGVHIGRGLGRADLVDQLRSWHASTAADGAFSWFGPVGALLVVAAVPIAVVEVRRRQVARTAIVLAAAPLVAIALLSLIVSYQRYQGRYFISAFALCAATFGGYALTRRWLGTAVVGVAAVTALLTFVNAMGKPTGITVLGENASDSVWSMPRWEQQGILRSTPAERDEVRTMRFVEEHVPGDASLGIALVGNSFAEPYFGGHFERPLTIVDEGDVLPGDLAWVVASPGRTLVGCTSSWAQAQHGAYGWSVWRRIRPDTCSSTGRLA
jgi:4-amino-4-deoxy-L-arabinose transferase-like glycosyltransferase